MGARIARCGFGLPLGAARKFDEREIGDRHKLKVAQWVCDFEFPRERIVYCRVAELGFPGVFDVRDPGFGNRSTRAIAEKHIQTCR